MFEVVPSEYMRAILKESGCSFTDFQKAAMIWNAPDRSWEEKIEALRELAGQTENASLRTQIEERLWHEDEAYRRFTDNPVGRYVYVAAARYDIQEESVGFFADYEMAKEYVLKKMRDEDRESAASGWFIRKQMIVQDRSDLKVKNRGRWNPWIFPGMADEEEEKYEDYDGWCTSAAQINGKGKIQFFYTGEMSREEEQKVDSYDPGRFEASFIKIPFEAQKGDVVRKLACPDGNYTDYGVLMCDTDQWEKYLRDIEERHIYVDFSDIQVPVYFLTPLGIWSHEHVNPLYLEIGEMPLAGKDERQRAYVRAMSSFSEYWHYNSMGTRTEEAMAVLEKRVIETADAYRDACVEYEVHERMRMEGRVVRAEKIEDIMA